VLSDYRSWLVSEQKLLANASHHAYSFGQANMAQRAIERLDQELAGKAALVLERATGEAALQSLDSQRPLEPPLEELRQALTQALDGGA